MPVAVKTKAKTQAKQPKVAVQSQVEEQVVVGPEQSLLVLSTLLNASVSCITFLRGLLPDDSFEDNHIGGSTTVSESQGDGTKGLRIKSIKRGFSSEADKLLDMTEKGVMDALKKGYLKSVIFFIYLDPKDPDNIVESYTISIFDAASSGGMSLQTTGAGSASWTTLGAPVTVGEVKKAVKKIIRNLIVITQNYKDLPQRRFIDVKLLYTPETPDDYEPPCFQPCNDKLYFATHSQNEAPEKSSVGKMQTGYHGVAVKFASIVDFLPYGSAADSQVFGGETPRLGTSQKRKHGEQEALAEDAVKRTCLWDAEALAKDRSDFEDVQAEAAAVEPMGVRGVDGVLQPAVKDISGRHRERSALMTPGGRTVVGFPAQNSAMPLSPTQPLHTQPLPRRQQQRVPIEAETPPAQGESLTRAQAANAAVDPETAISRGIDTLVLFEKQREVAQMEIDIEMEETSSSAVDPVDLLAAKAQELQVKTLTKAGTPDQDVMSCACEDPFEDGTSYGCDDCHSWLHEACTGYVKPIAIPEPYTCIKCEIKPKLQKMDENAQADILHKLKRFVQVRRLLARYWFEAKAGDTVPPIVVIKKQLACNVKNAEAQITNLVKLGFIDVKRGSGKSKRQSAARHVWAKTNENEAEYLRYFQPSGVHQQALLDEADRLVGESNMAPTPVEEPQDPDRPFKITDKLTKASRGVEPLDVTMSTQ